MPEGKPVFVLDASVIINFLGSGRPQEILESLDAQILIAEPVFREVSHDPSKRVSPQAWLREIEAKGLVQVIKLYGDALLAYFDLVSAPPPENLDDGEAATIAVAMESGAMPVLDEKRARRIFRSRYPGLPLASTAELFRRANDSGRISRNDSRMALFDALRIARMQVAPDMAEWVVNVIGVENAKQCPSLPRKFRGTS